MPTSWYELEKQLRQEVRDNAVELMQDAYPEDRLAEIVDCSVPIYTSELMELAADNLDLAVRSPEILAFDGECSAVNAVAGNVYEEPSMAAADEWESLKKEMG